MDRGHTAAAPGVSRPSAYPGKDTAFSDRIARAIDPRFGKWRVIAPHELGEAELSAWRQIQTANPQLASPFLSPEFTLAFAACRPDTRIAIRQDGGQIVAFFAFHKQRRIGHAIGRHLADFQAVIASPALQLSVPSLLRDTDLDICEFQNLLPLHSGLESYAVHKAACPAIDLRQGYAVYKAERRAAGTEQIKKAENLARRLHKDFGPLRFEYRTTDPAMFKVLIDWRNRDLRSHKWSDGFQSGTIDLFERLYASDALGCSGVLSALYAGERLAAIHFGIRSANRLHYWVPSYDPELARCSPGIILLLRLAEAAAEAGIQQIDLGPGNHEYKSRLANAHTLLIRGYFHRPSFAAAIRLLRTNTSSILHRVSLDVPAKRIAQWLHHT